MEKKKEKFYYIDEDGNKKKYGGAIISNEDGSYNGILTLQNKELVVKEIQYHPEINHLQGYYSYYSYTNSEGVETPYYGQISKDEDGASYFTYVDKVILDLNYHPKVEGNEDYYTYTDKSGREMVFKGTIQYNNQTNTYYGIVK